MEANNKNQEDKFFENMNLMLKKEQLLKQVKELESKQKPFAEIKGEHIRTEICVN